MEYLSKHFTVYALSQIKIAKGKETKMSKDENTQPCYFSEALTSKWYFPLNPVVLFYLIQKKKEQPNKQTTKKHNLVYV